MKFHRFEDDTLTIGEWTNKFKELYKVPDRARQPEEFWNAVMAYLSSIGEAIRKNHYPQLLQHAASTFCWMCSYVSKCNDTSDVFRIKNTLSEIVGLKFPKICGHCKNNICTCDPARMDAEEDKSATYKVLFNEWSTTKWDIYTLSMWLDMFHRIYGGRIHMQTLESLGFHLLEEAGEQAMAVRNLIQFRGILKYKFEDIKEDFIEKISGIDGLIDEYETTGKALKKKYGASLDKEAFKRINNISLDPLDIKARLVKAKIDQVIEFADTFSWFCAVLIKLSYVIENLEHDENAVVKTGIESEQLADLHIVKALHNRYYYTGKDNPLKCYACRKTAFECKFFLVSSAVRTE